MSFEVRQGDCVELMAAMPAGSVDSVVCDPPAGVSFMNREWDHHRGGMNQWVEWMAEVLREALRVCKPGAHAFVWSLPRTSHWTGSALELAGWEVRDCVTHLFGSGFPKSHNLPNGFGTALKPAAEFWWLARKPLSGTVSATVLEHGTGALNIDGCRVEGNVAEMEGRSGASTRGLYEGGIGIDETWQPPSAGRWPANVILDEEAARLLDEQTGETTSTDQLRRNTAEAHNRTQSMGQSSADWTTNGYADSGGASRFFPTFTHDTLCVLCNLPCVEPAEAHLPPSAAANATAASDAQASLSLEPEGSEASSGSPATSAESPSRTTSAIEPESTSTARPSAPANSTDESVPSASDAGHLCKGCTIAIAQSDAATLPSHEGPPLVPAQAGAPFTSEPTRPTPPRSPASTAEAQDSTDTMSSTTTPPSLSGSAPAATPLATPIEGTGDEADLTRFRYQSKASRSERNAGLEGFEEQPAGGHVRSQDGGVYWEFIHPAPEGIGDWLREAREAAGLTAKELTGRVGAHGAVNHGGAVTNWEAEYNRPTPEQWWKLKTALGLDDRFDVVMTEQREVDRELFDDKPRQTARNVHPTVKPISLMRWLVRLVTPPGGTVLDPFTGSGSTGCAAVLEGFDFIGLEREEEYVRIAEARIAWWHKHRGDGEAAQILAAGEARDEVEATGQSSLFD